MRLRPRSSTSRGSTSAPAWGHTIHFSVGPSKVTFLPKRAPYSFAKRSSCSSMILV
jgi:hypothetical protein